MIRPILIHPDPRLKKVCDPVAEITPEIGAGRRHAGNHV
jgi:peptide deformylase